MSTPAELRIATRIHFSLKHLLGEGIDVETMLRRPDEAREILFVCQASGNAELVSLARQFVRARSANQPGRTAPAASAPAASRAATAPRLVDTVPDASIKPRAAAQQDLAWAQDTSGFGITQPAELGPEPAEPTRRWRHPSSWLRLGTGR